MERKELILNTVDDLVSNFLYYDRKEDEDLPIGSVEDSINTWEIDVSDIVSRFQDELIKGLKNG